MNHNFKTQEDLQNKFNNLSNQNSRYQLFITDSAEKYIKTLISNDINMIGLQINIKKSGCAGFSYTFKKVIKENYNRTDVTFEYKNDVKIFIPHTILPLISGSKLDYVKEGLGYALKFKNPKIHHLCGCGASFNI